MGCRKLTAPNLAENGVAENKYDNEREVDSSAIPF